MERRPPAEDEEIVEALNLHAAGHNKTEIAKRLGVARQTVQGWFNTAEQRGLVSDHVVAEKTIQQEKLGLLDKIRELESQLKTIQRDNLTSAKVRESIIGLKAETPKPPKWVTSLKDQGSAGVPVTIWSDWHWGETVEPAQVNGINEYGIVIAQRRARSLVDHTLRLCRRMADKKGYPGIILCLGGDMISGDIHEELSETNELPSMPTLLDLFGVLIWAIEKLADEFGRVFIPCVAGNHGRTTKSRRFKNRAYSNFDWLLYCFLELHFGGGEGAKRDERIQFYVPDGLDAYFKVLNHRFLLTHGDNLGTRGGDGIIGIVGPVIRGDWKIRASNEAVGQPYDTLVIGHWHQYMALDRVIVNGCLKGYDEFAMGALRARPEAPRQALWFVHKDHGIISHWPVYCDEEKPREEAAWVSWQDNV